MIRKREASGPREELVAYFCAEFAVDERLPIYAGGLGVLAGDHLKTAGDLGLALVGVGLYYHGGYFTQRLDPEGRQQAAPAEIDRERASLRPVADADGRELRVQIPMAQHAVQARVWRKDVGPVPLYLLDCEVPENAEEDRAITARLYEAGHDLRLKQEIVLGIGGVRAVFQLGLQPTVWHVNEGHAAFQALERIREEVARGRAFSTSLESVAASTVFTTHTPVAAGHDVFTHGQLRHWLGDYLGTLHATERRLFSLGHNAAGGDRFNMTAFAIRCSRFRNAVSRVHRGVTAEMERYVWPQVPPAESPIGHVTNGVHLPTFLAPAWAERLDRHAPGWRGRVPAQAEAGFVDAIDDATFAAVRRELRLALADELQARLSAQLARNGAPPEQVAAVLAGLDRARRNAPVIGFARRFASYKRATLLLQDPDRLARLLGDEQRPALLVFAGKAHPHDQGGQELIRQLWQCSRQPEFAGRLLVVEGYDLALARRLVQGCDLWLNTPEFPMEASGTSGMKSAANGGVNVSVLDGWWAEGYDGGNGWGIEPVQGTDPAERDRREAERLFEILEREALAEFHGDGAGPSSAWLARARRSMRTAIAHFSSARMLDEYRQRFYEPSALLGQRLSAGRSKAARNLARWRKLVLPRWDGVTIEQASGSPLRVLLRTNGIPAQDIRVEAETRDGRRLPLPLVEGDPASGEYCLEQEAAAEPAAIRAWPAHELLPHPLELGLLLRRELPP